MFRSLFDNFWDRNRDGSVSWTEFLAGAMTIMAYVMGIGLMATTWPRSLHLLSSDYFNPNLFGWWPFVASGSPEIGLLFSWVACEVGFRKGNGPLIGVGVIGFIIFFFVIGTMQIYDVELVRGADMTHIGKLGEFVASVISMFTIGYLIALTSLVSAMEGAKSSSGYTKSTRPMRVTRPQPTFPSLEDGEEESREHSGVPLIDPLGRRSESGNLSGNGAGEEHPQRNFIQPPATRR